MEITCVIISTLWTVKVISEEHTAMMIQGYDPYPFVCIPDDFGVTPLRALAGFLPFP